MITIGTAIIYVLSGADALAINRRRTNGASIAARMKIRTSVETMVEPGAEPVGSIAGGRALIQGWPEGAQAHIGNDVKEGQRYPGVVVRDWAEESGAAGVDAHPNLQVWLDGTDSFWVTSAEEDGSKTPAPGTYSRA